MRAQHRGDLVVNKEYLYRNYKSYDDLGYNVSQRKKLSTSSSKRNRSESNGKLKINQYESPFLQQAREKALERAKEKKFVNNSNKPSTGNVAWNDDFTKSKIDYFDGVGKLEKAIIFKREKRIPPETKHTPTESGSTTPRMTRRRNKDDIPLMPSRMRTEIQSSPVPGGGPGGPGGAGAGAGATPADQTESFPKPEESFQNFQQINRSQNHNTSETTPTEKTQKYVEEDYQPPQSAASPKEFNSNPHVNSATSPSHSHSQSHASAPLFTASYKPQFQQPVQPAPSNSYHPHDNTSHPPSRTESSRSLPSHPPLTHFEPEVIRVKTRGTSPFNSADFDKLFAFDSHEVPSHRHSANSFSAKPQFKSNHHLQLSSPRSPLPYRGNGGGGTMTDIEAATLRILESQTKAQEVNGDMIGKFTNLVAELGKIITHREAATQQLSHPLPSPSATTTKKMKQKKRVVDSFISQTPRSQSVMAHPPPPPPEPSLRIKKITQSHPKKSHRSNREEVFDHILQRLQVMESQELAISETLKSLTIENQQIIPSYHSEDKETTTSMNEKNEKNEKTATNLNFIPPPATNTFEVTTNILTLAEVGSGWLMADGREEKRTRQTSASSQPFNSRSNGLIAIRAPPQLKQDLNEYRQEFKRITKLKESVFRHHKTTLAEVADSLTDHIVESLLEEAAEEFENVFTDLAEKFIDKI